MFVLPGNVFSWYKPGINKPSLFRIQSELKCARVTGVLDFHHYSISGNFRAHSDCAGMVTWLRATVLLFQS